LSKINRNTDENNTIGKIQWHLLTKYSLTIFINIHWRIFFFSSDYRGNYNWNIYIYIYIYKEE
jgi:hypothetical protein